MSTYVSSFSSGLCVLLPLKKLSVVNSIIGRKDLQDFLDVCWICYPRARTLKHTC